MIGFDGKLAPVTGGSGGIGAAVCRGLANLGAHVAPAGHGGQKAKACADAIGGCAAPFDAISVADSRRMVDDVAARHMIPQGGGKQVHIGSVRTQIALRGWAPHRINVNVVAPTFVRTDMVAPMLADPAVYRSLLARIPLGRTAEPEEVRDAVLFFMSSASDFVTGQTPYVDGGITATQ
jgi:NAD(P)-dependent dehydrogenase (short-subunit alcohol dehydrogenase family)